VRAKSPLKKVVKCTCRLDASQKQAMPTETTNTQKQRDLEFLGGEVKTTCVRSKGEIIIVAAAAAAATRQQRANERTIEKQQNRVLLPIK
jgi:hypothetical protein